MKYTWLCATLSAGSVKYLTELIVTNQLMNGLALIRPPGHHAMRSEACGYCIFNNVAITVASLIQPNKQIKFL
ncbi:Polyamine deacetylase HDAC10 [Schistosoma japonicum]|nr:Polyamine deacetylase HDAC10 [Schistosoma japonicum]